ncbi:MAG TPA: cyclase family protein [Gemmatimonadaceae bacterium]|jgi:arylformamidase|nr:cyclase family protein [Gemmatimonadaceae bacterium]
MSTIYDVSLPILSGGLVYPGNPEIAISPQQEISKGASSNVSLLSFGSHTGTHVDAQKHIFDGGLAVDAVHLDVLMGPAILIAAPDDAPAVTESLLRAHDLTGQERVLIRTRNSGFIRQRDFVRDYTYLAPDGAEYLVSIGVKLVGIDYMSIEQFHSGHHMTHRTLLGRGVVIVEGLDLSVPPPGRYDLRVLPLRLAGLDGAPARAVLVG